MTSSVARSQPKARKKTPGAVPQAETTEVNVLANAAKEPTEVKGVAKEQKGAIDKVKVNAQATDPAIGKVNDQATDPVKDKVNALATDLVKDKVNELATDPVKDKVNDLATDPVKGKVNALVTDPATETQPQPQEVRTTAVQNPSHPPTTKTSTGASANGARWKALQLRSNP